MREPGAKLFAAGEGGEERARQERWELAWHALPAGAVRRFFLRPPGSARAVARERPALLEALIPMEEYLRRRLEAQLPGARRDPRQTLEELARAGPVRRLEVEPAEMYRFMMAAMGL